jgi:hypothetical protein
MLALATDGALRRSFFDAAKVTSITWAILWVLKECLHAFRKQQTPQSHDLGLGVFNYMRLGREGVFTGGTVLGGMELAWLETLTRRRQEGPHLEHCLPHLLQSFSEHPQKPVTFITKHNALLDGYQISPQKNLLPSKHQHPENMFFFGRGLRLRTLTYRDDHHRFRDHPKTFSSRRR